MICIYRTPKKHHIAMSNVMKTECGKFLSMMDMVRVIPGQGITKEQFRELHRLRPFCKTCTRTKAWIDENWRVEDDI
jgi:hypothetical protein